MKMTNCIKALLSNDFNIICWKNPQLSISSLPFPPIKLLRSASQQLNLLSLIEYQITVHLSTETKQGPNIDLHIPLRSRWILLLRLCSLWRTSRPTLGSSMCCCACSRSAWGSRFARSTSTTRNWGRLPLSFANHSFTRSGEASCWSNWH